MCKETLKIYQASLKGYAGPSSQNGDDDDTKHNVKVGNEDGEINQKAEDRPPTRHIGHEMRDAGSSQTTRLNTVRGEKNQYFAGNFASKRCFYCGSDQLRK